MDNVNEVMTKLSKLAAIQVELLSTTNYDSSLGSINGVVVKSKELTGKILDEKRAAIKKINDEIAFIKSQYPIVNKDLNELKNAITSVKDIPDAAKPIQNMYNKVDAYMEALKKADKDLNQYLTLLG